MAIWKALFGQAAQQAGRKAMQKAQEKAREPETRAQAKRVAEQATAQAKRTVQEVRGDGNPGRAAGRAVGGLFVKLKQNVDKGFDAPPRDWGGEDSSDDSKKG
jgi:hypothetical protein